jgi:glycosyltransferase involved in cell wall biosynthesis
VRPGPTLPRVPPEASSSVSGDAGSAALHVSLDVPLPRELRIGKGTAVFVAGTCFCPAERIVTLELVVDGHRQPLNAFGMPRLDFFDGLHPELDPFEASAITTDPASEDDPKLHGYASGFWGLAVVRGPARERVTLALRAGLASGATIEAPVASLEVDGAIADPVAWSPTDGDDAVAICMATYNPPPRLFHRQIESIRAQTHKNWICVISDDCSDRHGTATILTEVGDDPRFVVSRAPRRLGFYDNFERALAMAPPQARYLAPADQDDRWDPEKLSVLLSRIGTAKLIYSDARVVGRDGTLIADTYWSTRRNNHSDLLSLLVANAVTGAASLLDREVLEYALPFPPAQFAHFHDHWLALVASSIGEIDFVDRPLYDYVQHGAAFLGHAAANQMPSLRERLTARPGLHERIRMRRLHYFVDVSRLLQLVALLQLRCGERLSAGKRRKLQQFARADRSVLSSLSLAGRGLRELVGRPETLGAEWMLFNAFVWKRLLQVTAQEAPQKRLRLDAVPPRSLALRPTAATPAGVADEISYKIAPLDLAVSSFPPRRVNLLIPTFDLQHFFGGYIAKLNLAARLADRGQRVRVIAVDPVGPLPPNWKRQIESYSGLQGLLSRVEVEFARAPSPLEVSLEDRFIATTWWTAHIAADAARRVGHERFLYLIQEYEPFTFPMGTYAALAAGSYGFPHFGIFSTEFLRDYFRLHRLGAFADDQAAGERNSISFQNAITDVRAPSLEALRRRGTRRLLFYARPEDHAARNMFELGVLAIGRALSDGTLGTEWELRGIGTTNAAREINIGGGAKLELLPRAGQAAYAEMLPEHDVGLALMYTPHPSLVPIEMAAGGLLTVTNAFENKTAQALSAISENLITADPTIDSVAAALGEAVRASDDLKRRVQASAVNWCRDWPSAFDETRMDAVIAALQRD